MKLTLEIPDNLASHLDEYLKNHPEETLFSLVKETLEIKISPKDTAKLLELAGIVKEEPRRAAEQLSER